MNSPASESSRSAPSTDGPHYRFHRPHLHLTSPFGQDWFALKAEAFARFFGTPLFLVGQTAIVAVWIGLNATGTTKFDVYPFILLNLAFSLQAAYAAPLILLAQTRQADRDKAHAEADALHREALANASDQRLKLAAEQTALLVDLMQQNTELTAITKGLTERVETLTAEMHARLVQRAGKAAVPPVVAPAAGV
ncbi:MAG TPA: DUF1003 domain-containing protein [Candidatus Limnocylindria bacterium]|nr:DUF1003 domain-containing protein [Candidatus Limnocylindria bacterium]